MVALPPPFPATGPQSAWGKQDPLPSKLQESCDIPKKPQGCNEPEATTSVTSTSNPLEGSKPALPGSGIAGGLLSIQLDFQIPKCHPLIPPEPQHSPCPANSSCPQGSVPLERGLVMEQGRNSGNRRGWRGEKAQFMDKTSPDTSPATELGLAAKLQPIPGFFFFFPKGGSCFLSRPWLQWTKKKKIPQKPAQQLEIPAPNAAGVCCAHSFCSLHPSNPRLATAPGWAPRAGRSRHPGATGSRAKVTLGGDLSRAEVPALSPQQR